MLLEARGLTKFFPGVQALDNVSLTVDRGEVLAVVGENGAGKSTLMKILAGADRPDAGEILFDGKLLQLTGVRDALARGVVLIHQELNLAGPLSVGANLFLGREHLRGGFLGWLDRPAMSRVGTALLSRVGLDVPMTLPVRDLPIGQQQLVEIARALACDARVLIMDEPTSSLSQRETERLFDVIADLKRAGVAVVYISHRLAEVKAVADRVTVLRDGKNAGELSRDQVNHTAMVRLMVGRELKHLHSRKHQARFDAPLRFEVRGIRFLGGSSEPISLNIRRGEIVGLAGLVGSGRTELAEALFGVRTMTRGQVRIDGEGVAIHSPRHAIRRGILLVPEDRRIHGLILDDGVDDNLSLPNLNRVSRLGVVLPRRVAELAEKTVTALKIKTSRLQKPVGLLSGGNQQKVVFGKWLARGPKVLILDEPTRGVDVGARAEIYDLMDQLTENGVAILMISSDLEEILGVSDRVLVMHEKHIAGELTRDKFSEETVMRLATGAGH